MTLSGNYILSNTIQCGRETLILDDPLLWKAALVDFLLVLFCSMSLSVAFLNAFTPSKHTCIKNYFWLKKPMLLFMAVGI